MEKGIAIYIGLDNTAQENLNLLEQATGLGITKVFSSLHIPETNTETIKEELQAILDFVKQEQLEFVCDISPATCQLLGLEELTPAAIQKLGIARVRMDYGFTLDEIAIWSHAMPLQLNASTLTSEALATLTSLQANFANIEALHNFYPRPHTGLGLESFQGKNNLLHHYGIAVGAFVPTLQGRKRSPLQEGLPTLEAHRHLPTDLSTAHLLTLGVDSVYIGDSLPTDKELLQFSLVGPLEVWKIRWQNYSYNVDVLPLLEQPFTVRADMAQDVIRLEEGRPRFASIDLPVFNTAPIVKGDITLDNNHYSRYKGELQISLVEQPADPRTNVLGRIIPEDLQLLPLITRGTKIQLIRSDTMDVQVMIKRINELAKKKREEGLNPEEQAEQKELYKEYLAMIRGQLKSHLENIEIVDKEEVQH